nr:MAG TPA: hypothetical protein [Caudoviricetes sp.]
MVQQCNNNIFALLLHRFALLHERKKVLGVSVLKG